VPVFVATLSEKVHWTVLRTWLRPCVAVQEAYGHGIDLAERFGVKVWVKDRLDR
jgi:hypothetical protein